MEIAISGHAEKNWPDRTNEDGRNRRMRFNRLSVGCFVRIMMLNFSVNPIRR